MCCIECCIKFNSMWTVLFPDPVRKGPVCGGGREADSEADHGVRARHPVLLSAHQPSQQRRGSAAPRHRHHRPGHPKNQTHGGGKDQRRRHGDCAATDCADHRQSQVVTMDQSEEFGLMGVILIVTCADFAPISLLRPPPVAAFRLLVYQKGFLWVGSKASLRTPTTGQMKAQSW